MYKKEVEELLPWFKLVDLWEENCYLYDSPTNPTTMGTISTQSEIEFRLFNEYNEKRDPILKHIHLELVKIRKWLTFFGILTILGILVGVVIALNSKVGF